MFSPQTCKQLQIHLRFATRYSCQTGRHSRNSHMRMRIKTNLEKSTDILWAQSKRTHPWASAKCTQVNTNLWKRTQTLLSPKQTDTLEHTHPLNLNDNYKSQQTHRGRAVSTWASPVQHTLAADEYKTWVSQTDTAASLLNLFKQCNEHYANTVKSAEVIECTLAYPLYKYYYINKRNTAVQLLTLSALCNTMLMKSIHSNYSGCNYDLSTMINRHLDFVHSTLQ